MWLARVILCAASSGFLCCVLADGDCEEHFITTLTEPRMLRCGSASPACLPCAGPRQWAPLCSAGEGMAVLWLHALEWWPAVWLLYIFQCDMFSGVMFSGFVSVSFPVSLSSEGRWGLHLHLPSDNRSRFLLLNLGHCCRPLPCLAPSLWIDRASS